MREMLSFLFLLAAAALCIEAAHVDVIDYREPTINNLFQTLSPQNTYFSGNYTLLDSPYIDLAEANGNNSAKAGRNSLFKYLFFT
jgi:hypothetical protein